MPTTRSIILDVEERKRGNALLGAANDMDKLARETDKASNGFQRFKADIQKVQVEVDRATDKVRDLKQQFARTGDSSLLVDIRREERQVRAFRQLASDLVKDAEAAGIETGAAFGKGFSDQARIGMVAVISFLAPAIAGLVVVLGATLAGALIGAVGTGGLIGGILAASQNPRVKQAFGSFADSIKDTFFGAGASFVEPLVKSLATLARGFKDLNLARTFELAAPSLQIIVKGLLMFVNDLMPGVNEALKRAVPFAKVAAEGFGLLGDSISDVLTELLKTPGTLEGLILLFGILSAAIRTLGKLMLWSAEAIDFLVKWLATLSDWLTVVARKLHLPTGPLEELGRIFHDVADRGAQAVDATTDLGHAAELGALLTRKFTDELTRENDELTNTLDLLQKALGLTLSVDQANLALQRDLITFNQELADNGKHWNDNTEAGLRQREMFAGLLGDLQRIRQANIDAGGSVKDANAAYDAGVTALLKLAAQAGATKAQLEQLKGNYLISVQVNLIAGAIARLGQVFQNVPHFAGGGPVTANNPYVVGERGPELFVPAGNGTIVPNGAGMGATNVTIVVPGSDDLGSAVVAYLAKHAQVVGGGNVQLAITGRMS
jgi:hypothetical protein